MKENHGLVIVIIPGYNWDRDRTSSASLSAHSWLKLIPRDRSNAIGKYGSFKSVN